MLDQRQRPCSGVFIINFGNLSHHALVFLLLTLNRMTSPGFKQKWSLRGALQNNCFTKTFKIYTVGLGLQIY